LLKRNISSINSWSDLKNLLDTKTKQEKGQAFEELTKYFLEYNPVYKTKLKHIWLHKEIPSSVSKKLNLPSNDQGIDLIAETFEGTYWAIQCKYLQDEDQRLSHRAISTFISLSTGIAKDITYCLVCTTVDEYAKIYQGKENIGFVNSDEWRKLDKEFFDWLRNKLSGKEKNLIPYKPKPHQTKALQEAKSYFTKENNPRGKLVFPCGAGKSLTGYWITRELKSKSIIVAVPSLSLVKQTLEVYLRESVANNDKVSWLCVCSDEGIGTNDDIAIHTNEIGVPCVTDKNYIAKWIKNNSKNKTIIFTTYQSGKTISEACKIAKHEFDLGIMDEAHKTVGDKDKLFSHLLFDQNIKIKKRIFMTATERRYAGSSDLVLSMDDVNVYGDTFTQMSFKEAIEIGILSDYRIITLFISNDEVKSLIEKNAFVKPTGKEWDQETEARTLASLIALRKAMTEYPIHHAVTFHSSIKKAEAFEQSQSVFSKAYPKFAKVESFHVSGAMPTSRRGKIVDEFAQTNKGIITNAKCLTEGVDVPNIDCVLFADPRKSTVDIVQAVGRALRKKDGKDFGYVILPVFTESNNTDEIINSDEFKEILSTIRALASNDERIIEYFKDVSKGVKKNKKDSLVHFDIDVQLSERINEKELIDSIQLKTWDKLAKLSWMPFEEARNFVHSLKLKSRKEWDRFSKSDKRPLDIPMNPNGVYKNNGWISVGDWLGTGRIADQYKKYRPFHLAKEYVQSLNLIDRNDWIKYCRSGKKPDDIPTSPNKTYENKGWKGLKDWLGTGTSEFRNFGEAKKYASSLHLNSESDWKKHTKSKEFPIDVPLYPQGAYKNKGWKSWGDFLGTGYIANIKREYKSFIDAREFVKNLHLKGEKEWRAYLKTKKKPNNIPSDPASVYKDEWKGMGDFLGTGTISPRLREYLPYEEARIFARLLDLKSRDQWKAFCKSGKKPANIPETPDQVYKSSWKGMGDFLGTGNIAPSLIQYKSFDEAKQFVRTKGIKTYPEWKIFCESGQRPKDIPSNPNATYKDKWKGFKDFFGTEIEYLDCQKRKIKII
jgi:superfamily II DNA or RNA helicase